MMNEESGQSGKGRVGSRNMLLAVALLLLLPACGRQQDLPTPPKAPPRPVTFVGTLSTADYIVPARPALPQPGEM
jgi:hypothetical protein